MMAIKAEPDHSYRVPTGVSGPHATPVTLLGIKYRYKEGQRIEFKVSADGRRRKTAFPEWVSAKVIGIHDQFMTIQAPNYRTTIDYPDILTESVKVREA